MAFKNKESAQVEKTVAKAVNFEVSVAELARRSEKRAWKVAGAAAFVALAMTGVVLYMLPLKEKVPYVAVVDPYTGNAVTSKLSGDYRQVTSLGSIEALNRANIAQYVSSRESYDFAMMKIRDWQLTHAMSSPEESRAYAEHHDIRKNPSAPLTEYGRDRAVRVKILSITPSNRTSGSKVEGPGGSATIRFQRSVYDKKNGNERLLDNRLATLEFVYNSELTLNEKDRHLNPLGFQVLNYRVDSDFSDTRPVAPQPDVLESAAPSYNPNQQPGAAGAYPSSAYPAPAGGYPAQYPGEYPQGAAPAGAPTGAPQQGVPQQGVPQYPPAAPGQGQPYPAQPQGVQPQPQAAPPAGPVPNQANGASY